MTIAGGFAPVASCTADRGSTWTWSKPSRRRLEGGHQEFREGRCVNLRGSGLRPQKRRQAGHTELPQAAYRAT